MAYKSTLSSVNIQKALDTIHEAITIGGGILSLTPESTKDEIFSAFGGQNTLTEIAGKSLNGNISLGIDLNDGNGTIGNVASSVWADGSQIAESTIKLYVLYLYKGEIVYDEFICTYIDNVADVKLNQKRTEVGYGSANGTGFNDIKWTDYFSTDSGYYYPANGDILYLSQETYDSLNDVSETAKITRVLAPCGVFFSTAITTSVSGNINQITFAPIPAWKSTGTKTTDNIFVITITSHTPDSTHPEPYQATVEIGNMVTKTRVENVLTGNIASHTHDDEYQVSELETDAPESGHGDINAGITFAGSGTKEDPYLIQSCTDYYYFIRTDLVSRDYPQTLESSTTTYFKITKNLTFDGYGLLAASGDNKSTIFLKNIELDGNGSVLHNLDVGFSSDDFADTSNSSIYGAWILPYMQESYIHDINFTLATLSSIRIAKQTNNINITSLYNIYNRCVFDISIDATSAEYPGLNPSILLPSVIMNPDSFGNFAMGNFMGYHIHYNTQKDIPITISVGLKKGYSGYIYIPGYSLSAGSTTVGTGEIGLAILHAVDFDKNEFKYGNIENVILSSGGNNTAEVVSSMTWDDIKSQENISEMNGGKYGFALDKDSLYVIIPHYEIFYKGYARKENVLEKTNIQEYTPTEDYHPATKKYVDDQIASVESGGSSGGLTADDVLTKTNTTSYTPTSSYHPATKKYVDDNSVSPSEVLTKTNTTSYTPTSNYHPATKKYVDDQITNVESSGGGVPASQVLTKTNTTSYTPTSNYHPATKKYVDDTVSSAKSSLNSSITSVSNRVSDLESAGSSSMVVNVTSYLQEFLPDTAGEFFYTSSTRISSSDFSSLRSVISSGKMAYVKLSAGSGLSYGAVCPIALTYVSSSCIHFHLPYNVITSNIVGYIGFLYTNQSCSISEIQGNIAQI